MLSLSIQFCLLDLKQDGSLLEMGNGNISVHGDNEMVKTPTVRKEVSEQKNDV